MGKGNGSTAEVVDQATHGATLFDRLGGQDALKQAVDAFYARLGADERINYFFKDSNITKLKAHQYNFMRYAFSNGQATYKGKSIKEGHARLFEMGLNETHFDIVATHFVETLKSMNVDQGLIDEAVAIIVPLREVFKAEAEEHAKELASKTSDTLFDRLGGQDALKQAVDAFYARLGADDRINHFFKDTNIYKLKAHQYNFMRYAFSNGQATYKGKSIREGHERLFAMGLNETHFDIVASHFVATLQGLKVDQALIDEAVAIIVPLREVFKTSAEEYQKEKEAKAATTGGCPFMH
eukprot:CAMPEP_0184707710 /NCGR_PEP_ID=MMETSP0313-20130426/37390_1 /TAXON_ID=2792 /ORGANISM="Porphyridium aerugineum, Strain SAG 1380-2" /LENGTH=295 /DNA_ID=CAMNT_0027169291 /DNA_START=1250 /DNA_END=2137 /DNA_ORIENTATION=-